MSKRMLADVLWEAANAHLSAEPNESGYSVGVHKWSCWAIDRALGRKPSKYDRLVGSHWRFLRSLGLNPSPYTGPQLGEDQGVRYMWLLLAMHVAEDEGIEL